MVKLCINTANEELVVALSCNNKVFSRVEKNVKHHNEVMLPLIDEMLKEQNLDITDVSKFGVVIGPGSFTGIRVGVSTIKAFRDTLKVEAKGINNLDFLFALAAKQKSDTEVVAILGSRNCFFVAKKIGDYVYKYDRTLSLKEVKKLTAKPIGMFSVVPELNCFKVKIEPEVLFDMLEVSSNIDLKPVYYQLSQAENEKISKIKYSVRLAKYKDAKSIFSLENLNILNAKITERQILDMIKSNNYKIYCVLANEEIVGFIILQITDEIAIESLAVSPEFRNLGLATKLVKKAENLAKKLQISTVSLEVSSNNLKAFVLYEKLGFKTRRIRKKYYLDKSDAIEMSKFIG